VSQLAGKVVCSDGYLFVVENMAGEVVVDALPYIDQGYDEPGVREAASAMVEEETRRYRPTKNYLEHLPSLNLSAFETEIMRSEFERTSMQ
jgi:pre-mRNA-splicing factor SPF27